MPRGRVLQTEDAHRGMGLLKDNSTLLRLAADYLDNHKKKTQKESK